MLQALLGHHYRVSGTRATNTVFNSLPEFVLLSEAGGQGGRVERIS
jgi:hypothetical protein